jgi:hypothetical protein
MFNLTNLFLEVPWYEVNVPVAIILPSACSIIEEPVYNISSNPVPTLKSSR